MFFKKPLDYSAGTQMSSSPPGSWFPAVNSGERRSHRKEGEAISTLQDPMLLNQCLNAGCTPYAYDEDKALLVFVHPVPSYILLR